MTPNLDGKVALITGGTRGIGFAIARAMLDARAAVVITGARDATVAEARDRLEAFGPVLAVRADVRDPSDVERCFAAATERFGGLDILVNNAGVGRFVNVADMSLEEWNETIGTNLTGVFLCCHAAIPLLRQRGGGWIINISSLAGKNSFVGGAAYCASKAGLNAFSEALMQEIRHDDIRVAYVMPGSVRTGFQPGSDADGTDWKLAPEDVAQVVLDLVAHERRSLPSRVEIRPAKPPRR